MSTKIEWTDETWSPVTGCTRISEGCLNCYIERTPPFRMERRRFSLPVVGGTTGVRLHPERLRQPLHWRKPRKVFVCSMADLFHEDVPDEHIANVFAVMAIAGQHTFQVLTKRPTRMRSLLSSVEFQSEINEEIAAWAIEYSQPDWFDVPNILDGPLPNVWIGTSVESQKWADIRIPALCQTPAAVRFLSCEPLLGPVDLHRPIVLVDRPMRGRVSALHHFIDWVIVGGESGPAAKGGPGVRAMHPDWARSLRDQCVAAGVPLHFKQWGDCAPLDQLPDDTVSSWEIRNGPGYPGSTFCHVGKKAAGRELDGRTWDEFPEVD